MKLSGLLSGNHRCEQTHNATRATQCDNMTRTAAVISAELGAANDAADALAGKLAAAQGELNEARSQYDTGVQAYALETAGEPDRSRLEAAISKTDALRRVSQTNRGEIAKLATELAAVELAETVTSDRELIPALTADATAKLEAFEQSASETKRAETKLFDALFGRSGLKREFATAELNTKARAARFELRDRSISAAKRLGYSINPDFETDGNINMAAPQRQHEIEMANYERDIERRRECAGIPMECGELLPEDADWSTIQ